VVCEFLSTLSGGFTAAVDVIEEVSVYGDAHLVPFSAAESNVFNCCYPILVSCVISYAVYKTFFLQFLKKNIQIVKQQ
jgi:hypothetical protein